MSSIRRNSVSQLAGRVATALLWLVATPFVLSSLGVERFGIWSLFFAFNAYLGSFDLGVGHTLLRYIAAQRPEGDRRALARTVRWGFWAALGMGLTWTLAIEILSPWIARVFHVPPGMMNEAVDSIRIFGLGLIVLFVVQAIMAALVGFERIDLSNLCQTIGVVVHIGALWVLLAAGAGLRGAALAGILGQAAAGLLGFVFMMRELGKVPSTGQAPLVTWRSMALFSAALQVLGILIMLQTHAPKLLVGVLGNLAMVTDFELAFRVAFAVGGLPIIMRDPVIPAVSRTYGLEGRGAVAPMFEATSRWVYAHSALTLGLMWLLAPDLTHLWLGPGNERIADLIRLWVVGYALYLAYSPGVAIARGMGMPRYEVISYASALATNVALTIWWVPLQGASGAVAAVAVSYGVGFLVFSFPFHRSAGVIPMTTWLRRDLLPRSFAGLAATALTWWVLEGSPLAAHLPPPGWVHGALTGVTFLTCFALCFFPLGDTQRLTAMIAQYASGAWPRVRSSQ